MVLTIVFGFSFQPLLPFLLRLGFLFYFATEQTATTMNGRNPAFHHDPRRQKCTSHSGALLCMSTSTNLAAHGDKQEKGAR